jgi:succinoglycan biosynthesis protein ExoO
MAVRSALQAPEEPLISVAIPAFNAADTIEDCLSSILRESKIPTEVVICDDASTDGTRARISSFRDPRIRLIETVEHRGPGAARDTAIAACAGRWITFCDADDMWLPGRSQALLEAAGGNENAVVFDDMMRCHSTSEGVIPWKRIRGKKAFGAHGRPVTVSIESWMRNRRTIMQPLFSRRLLMTSGARHSRHPFGEDSYFNLKLIAAGASLVYVPYAYYLYRISPGSATANGERYRLLREICEECAGDFRSRPKIYAALLDRIRRHRKLELYRSFLDVLKQRRLRHATLLLARHPWFAWEFACHNAKLTPYRIHRALKRGRPRGTKPTADRALPKPPGSDH